MSKPKPFTQLSHEVLVDNPWHRYCKDRYVRRDRTEGEYYYIDMPGAVGIIPVFENGDVLVCRQYRYLLGAWLWEFPIGGMEKGGDPLDTARRELREETGYAAERFTMLGSFAPYKGVSNERTHIFLAEGLTEVGQELEPEEQILVSRMSYAEARDLLLDQELGDGQSWGGLLLYERHLG